MSPPPPLPALPPIIAGGRGGPSIGGADSTGSPQYSDDEQRRHLGKIILAPEGEEPNPTDQIGSEPYGTTTPRTNPRKGKSPPRTIRPETVQSGEEEEEDGGGASREGTPVGENA